MIAIPNMSKPKECKECQWHLDFYIEDEQVGGLCTITEKDDKENTCPLIDIVKCGECKWWNRDGKRKDGKGWCENAICGLTKSNAFCSYGERRADDNTIKANK